MVLDAGEGRSLWHLGARMTFKALSDETENRFWAVEGLADSTMAVPLHTHSHEDEVWYVLEGEITFIVGDQERTVGAGAFAYIPRGTAHSFVVRSGTARWFGLGIPGGLDSWFFETGVPAGADGLPPATDEPPDIGAIVESLRRYGTETVGPPAR
jgi:quercetin dioxygenase-like cupin family protein